MDGILATRYAGESGVVIVAIIIRRIAGSGASTGGWLTIGGWFPAFPTQVAIVNNPVGENVTYVLPVAVACRLPIPEALKLSITTRR